MAVVWSLGARLYIVGHATVRLPWSLLDGLPLLDQVIPARIALYTALVCAVIVAIWVGRGAAPPAARWGLGILAAFLIIPASGVVAPGTNISFFNQRVSEPAFFTTDLYRKYLTPGELVLPIPYAENGLSMLWQARTGMYFRMASGYFGTVPPFYASQAIVPQLKADIPGPNAPQELESMLVSRHIGAIVAEPREVATWGPVIAKLRLKPLAVGGVLLYRVPETGLG